MRKPFYGVYIVAALFIVLFMLWGMVLNTFPIFLKPMAENMEWGRGALALALLMGSIGTAISAPIAGTLIDRMGARSVMTAGALMTGVGLLIGSRIQHLWQLYVVFAFIGAGLMFGSIIPSSYIIANWFASRRGTAMSWAFVGTSIGGMSMSPVANWIIINYGWRMAFLCSGLTILVTVVPVVLLVIRTRPADMGLEPYRDARLQTTAMGYDWGFGVKEALSLKAFWQIAAIMTIIGIVSGGIGNHCPAYLTDIGHSPTRAAFAWSVIMGVMTIGKLSIGLMADRWGASNTTAAAFLLFAVSILVLTVAKSYVVVMIFAGLYGFACGAPLILNPLLTGGYMGMKHFGALYGVLNMMSMVGGALGPVGAGKYFDVHGTYLPAFYVFLVLVLLGAMVARSMPPVPEGEAVPTSA